jgi:hypothetical protein
VLYLLLAATLAELIPAALMALAVPLVYVRLSLVLHETMHRHRAAQVTPWLRLGAILETPLALGYREHRALHLQHHRFNAAPGDPEYPLIASPAALAFLHALLVPERAALRWVRRHGIDPALAREGALRALLFSAALLANPGVFLVYLLSLRLSIACGGFVFHHLLHRHGARTGTFALPGGVWARRLGGLLFGREPMLILARHRAHHLWPQRDVHALPDLPDDLELPPGRLGPAACRAAAAPAATPTPRSPACAA